MRAKARAKPAAKSPRAGEREFLEAYRRTEYARPAATVDLVIFTVVDADLKVLLIRRGLPPFKGFWALPGGFVRVGNAYDDQGESIDDAAHRELSEETGLPSRSCYLEQLAAFGRPGRDPRTRVISIAYFALISADKIPLVRAGSDAAAAKWYSVAHEVKRLELAFDHEEILETALARVRSKLEGSAIVFELVPLTFTVTELRAAFEAVKGAPLDAANFRRRFAGMLADGVIVQAPGRRLTSTKPAKVYRFTRGTQG